MATTKSDVEKVIMVTTKSDVEKFAGKNDFGI